MSALPRAPERTCHPSCPGPTAGCSSRARAARPRPAPRPSRECVVWSSFPLHCMNPAWLVLSLGLPPGRACKDHDDPPAFRTRAHVLFEIPQVEVGHPFDHGLLEVPASHSVRTALVILGLDGAPRVSQRLLVSLLR